jgi:hypothetical protein
MFLQQRRIVGGVVFCAVRVMSKELLVYYSTLMSRVMSAVCQGEERI